MDINLIKLNIAGDFIQVILQDFFIKNSSAKKVGLYNLKYKYHADYDFFFRMIVKEKMSGLGTKKRVIWEF